MSASNSQEVTQLLTAWSAGNLDALARLTPLVEAELERLAHNYLKKERPGHTLQTTALVNEAYVRLIEWQNTDWQSRAHFIGVAANIMRKVLVDYGRRRQNQKHGGDQVRVSLAHAALEPNQSDPEVLALNEALDQLTRLDPRQGRIIELSFFGGLTNDEIAHVLGISERTVRREWNMARAWLFRALSKNN
jgi:RNA polymerase sigma-70 factor, ECF subfamily